MGHLQPATSMQVENSTFDSIMNKKIEQKLSKAMEISSYWVRGRVKQKTLTYLINLVGSTSGIILLNVT